MKTFTRHDGFTELNLLQAAGDHLGSAKVLFDRHLRCFDSAGYLCHLGMELVLKGILLNICNEFPNEHSLSKLRALIEKRGPKMNYVREHLDTIKMLDDFNELRYPSPTNPVEIGDDDWAGIENLFDFLVLEMPDSIMVGLKQLNHSSKGKRVLMRKKKTI